jgi:hypothetical protein
MSVTEKLMEVINEVLDEKEKEAILSVLDSADEIDFDDFWRYKTYKIGEKGLTSYSSYKIFAVASSPELIATSWGGTRKRRPWETHGGYGKGKRSMCVYTVRNRLKSAMEKLEKSSKLRAINAFSS